MRTYNIIHELDRGGMGRVYYALAELGQGMTLPVAVKVPRMLGHRDVHEMLLCEGALAMQLCHDHPNLVTVFDCGETRARDRASQGVPFLVMEFVDGVTASKLVEREPLTASMVRSIARAMLCALGFLHGRGVLHRDISTGNILIGRDGCVKLGDFGLIKQQRATTHSGVFRGTPAYASPEQLRGIALTPAADLFSLGAVLYKLATGKHPYGTGEPEAVLAAMNQGEPDRLGQLPADLASLIRGLLQMSPGERLTAARAIELIEQSGQPIANAAEISAVVNERSSQSPEAGPSTASDAVTFPALDGIVLTSHPDGVENCRSRTRWRRWAMAALALPAALMLGLASFGAWSLLQRDQAPELAAQPVTEQTAALPRSKPVTEPVTEARTQNDHAEPPSQRASEPSPGGSPAVDAVAQEQASIAPLPGQDRPGRAELPIRARRVPTSRPARPSGEPQRSEWAVSGPWQ